MVALEGREHEEGAESLFKEVMNENFPKKWTFRHMRLVSPQTDSIHRGLHQDTLI